MKTRRIITAEGKRWAIMNETSKRMILKVVETETQEIRLQLGMTQMQMAKALGISQPLYCKIETGYQLPSFEVSEKILGMRK